MIRKISDKQKVKGRANDNQRIDRFINEVIRGYVLDKDEINAPGFLNWEKFLSKIEQEGLAGIVYDRVKNQKLQLPALVENALHQRYFQNVARYIRFEKALLSLLEFDTVPIIILKGMSFINRIYPDSGLRSFSDIDILIRKQDCLSIDTRLIEIGAVRDQNYQNIYYLDGVMIDVHTDLFGISRINARKHLVNLDDSTIWETAVKVEEFGKTYYRLSANLEILFLCYHILKHSLLKKVWMVELGMLIKENSSEDFWNELITLIKWTNMNVSAYYVLHYLSRIIPGLLPDKVLKDCHTFKSNFIQRLIYSAILKGQKVDQFAELFFISSVTGYAGKIQFVKEVAFPFKGANQGHIQKGRNLGKRIVSFFLRIVQIIGLFMRWSFALLKSMSLDNDYQFCE